MCLGHLPFTNGFAFSWLRQAMGEVDMQRAMGFDAFRFRKTPALVDRPVHGAIGPLPPIVNTLPPLNQPAKKKKKQKKRRSSVDRPAPDLAIRLPLPAAVLQSLAAAVVPPPPPAADDAAPQPNAVAEVPEPMAIDLPDPVADAAVGRPIDHAAGLPDDKPAVYDDAARLVYFGEDAIFNSPPRNRRQHRSPFRTLDLGAIANVAADKPVKPSKSDRRSSRERAFPPLPNKPTSGKSKGDPNKPSAKVSDFQIPKSSSSKP
jgi:hypothetical protein